MAKIAVIVPFIAYRHVHDQEDRECPLLDVTGGA
jgi:hypothetical protein